MTITYRTKSRSTPASWTTTRKLYENGVMTQSVDIARSASAGYPQSSVPGYKGDYKEYYNSSDWRAVLESQGWLGTKGLTHRTSKFGGSLFSNTYRLPSDPLLYYITIQNGFIDVPSNVDIIESGSVRALAVQPVEADSTADCLSKARDLRVNLPVFFAEGKKTVDMLLETARTLLSAYGSFRKGRFKQAAKHLGMKKPVGTAANHWLAYQYGWSPILSDMVGASTMLYDWVERRDELNAVIRGKKIAAEQVVDGPEWHYLGSHPTLPGWIMIYSARRLIEARSGLRVTPQWSVDRAMAQLGLGSTDLLLTAWELTPFSFVFDWLVDVGGWLEQMSALQGLTVLDGWISTKTKYYGQGLEWPWGAQYSQADTMILWPYEVAEFSRRLWTGSPTYLRKPLLDGLKARRVTTLAALAVQLLGGDKKPGGYKP